MLFKELIEQHRVHRFVANTHNFPFVVANDQVGVYLFYLLSY